MSVTIKVVEKKGRMAIVECFDDKKQYMIMRSPIVAKLSTKKSLESAINTQLKVFKQPVWGGMSIVYLVDVE